jgi:hypothetical protein
MAGASRSILYSVVGILISGGIGGFTGWSAITLLGLHGLPAALVAAPIGMGVATALWIGLTVLLRSFGWLR